MTDKRDRISTDPGLGPIEPPGPSTLRSLEVVDDASPNPNAPVYYEPLPLVAVSDHRTLEIETVKLADDIDPRKLVTELRLNRPPAFVPASDSGWPPETALSSSQPPAGPARRWRTTAVLLSLLAALLLLVLARAVFRSSSVVAVGASSALSAAALAPPPVIAASAAAPSAVVVSAPIASSAVAEAPLASAAEPPSSTPNASPTETTRAALAPQHVVKQNPQPTAPSQSLAAPSSSKPKRAIY